MEYILKPQERAYLVQLKAELQEAEQNLRRVSVLFEGAAKILLATHGLSTPATVSDDCAKLISGQTAPPVAALHNVVPVGNPN